MQLEKPGAPLKLVELAIPESKPNELLIKVHACGICRTDLHVVDGELTEPKLPLIPGHQIVGTVHEVGKDVKNFKQGELVGVPWLGGSCGHCEFCKIQKENLCDHAIFTGYQKNGGFAEYCTANERFCFPIPKGFSDLQAAPLLCAGLIGYRSYQKAGDGKRIGLYGFGSAAHLVVQMAKFENKEVYAFTRKGDQQAQDFAKSLGANWAGSSEKTPPNLLDAAIIFAPAGELVPIALKHVKKGGKVICAGIHMSDIPSFPYEILWGERQIESVANLTRKDGEEFLKLAAKIPIQTTINIYPLERVNEALDDMRQGRFSGSAVIKI